MITLQTYNIFLQVMALMAVIVFISLFFVDAGYGKFYTRKWGPTIDNRLGWMLMECPVFFLMIALWLCSDRKADLARIVMLLIFELHYFQRSFIFPFLIRGKGRMPLSIILLSFVFNSLNALAQGGWIFYFSPAERYTAQWLLDPRFIAGTIVFFYGMYVNISSDSIIRHLRKPGDNAHYLPQGGMFRYVTSANYFGELLEWVGFAILTWSWAGVLFAAWTFANLGPRAARIYDRYGREFPDEFDSAHLKRMIPFIY